MNETGPRSVRRTLLWVALPALFAASGCTERMLHIRSDPSGADVIVDQKHVGQTPVDVKFVYGGQHEIILLKPSEAPETPGWKPLVVSYDSERFPYDTPVFDLFVDLAPFGAHDDHDLQLTMTPNTLRAQHGADPDGMRAGLRARADMLRLRAREMQLEAAPLPTPPAPETRPSAESRVSVDQTDPRLVHDG